MRYLFQRREGAMAGTGRYISDRPASDMVWQRPGCTGDSCATLKSRSS